MWTKNNFRKIKYGRKKWKFRFGMKRKKGNINKEKIYEWVEINVVIEWGKIIGN